MKKVFLLFFTCLLSISFAQISTTRMNEIRIDSNLAEVETALGQKLEVSKKQDDWLYKTRVNHNGSEFELGFTEFMDENNQTQIELFEITTESASLKTLSKIGIGNSLDDLWKAYKNYNISVWATWDESTEDYSKKERVFQLNDYDAGTVLYFYLRNDKVYKITLSFFEGC